MPTRFAWFCAIACATIGACGAVPTEVHGPRRLQEFDAAERAQLERYATFDLDCPKEALAWLKIDDKTRGVRGCGKKVRYSRICRQKRGNRSVWSGNYDYADECQWLRDGGVEPAATPVLDPPAAPPVDSI